MTVTAPDTSIVENDIRLVGSDGQTLIALLDAAYDAVVSEQLLDDTGGEETLTFSIPLNDPKAGLLQNEMCIRITHYSHDSADAAFQVTSLDAVYVIRTITKGYDDSGNKTFVVYCEARWYDLTTDDLITVQPAVPDAASAINAILAGTSWTLGVIGVPAAAGSVAWGSADLVTPLAALRSLPPLFGGELIFDTVNRQVSLIPRRGDQTPHLLYIHAGNMSHDVRTVDTTQLTTRVHPLGANSIDITSVNGNVPYIEDFSYFDTRGMPRQIRAQAITNDMISDPTALLAWARNQLTTMAQPITRWDIGISLIAGKAIPRLGDLVRVTDATMGLDTYARVSRREFNITQPWLTTLTVDTAAYTLATPAGGGTGLISGGSGTDVTIPNPPTGLHMLYGSGLDQNGNWNSYGDAFWTAPVSNSDGTPISDLDHYDIEVLPTGQLTWNTIGSTGSTSAGVGYLPVGPVQVRVRAVDHSGNRSAWTTISDTVPMPTPFYLPPSTPTLDADTLPLCIQVIWNGLNNNGVPYTPDVDVIEVHLVQGGATFTPTAGTLHSVVPAQLGGFVEPLTGLTPGVPYTVELVAVGRLDTHSKPSVAVTATVLPVGPTHLVYNGDQDNMVPDGSFETIAGQARLMADDTFQSCWSFITAVTAPGGRGAGAVAHGKYALMGTGGTLTGQSRALTLTTVGVQAAGQKLWVKCRYRNETTGGTCYLAVAAFDGTGALIETNGISLPASGSYTLAAYDYTLPTNCASYMVYVQMDQSVSAGYLFVDAVEVRSVIQTAIIDQLAVTDAQIASMSAGKITVGSLVADVTLSARIKTADSGARVEINSTGLFAFNSSGTNTVAIHNDGSASFTGTITGSTIIGGLIETATSGRRVVLDSSATGLIQFYSGTAGETGPAYIYGNSGSYGAVLNLVGPTYTGYGTPAVVSLNAGGYVEIDAPAGLGINVGTSYGSGISIQGRVDLGFGAGGYLYYVGQPFTRTPDSTATTISGNNYYNATDLNGYLDVPHGLNPDGSGRYPRGVVCTGIAPIGGAANLPIAIMSDTFGANTFRIRVFDQNGAPYAGKYVTLSWFAFT